MKNGLFIDDDETKRWFLNDKYHRENGPAIIYNTDAKHWYLNGLQHRWDGPAVTYQDFKAWYLYGIALSEKEYEYCIKKLKECKNKGIAKLRKNHSYGAQYVFQRCKFVKVNGKLIVLNHTL